MYWAVDLFASEYGWSKHDIFYDVYPDELLPLINQINRRRNPEKYGSSRVGTAPELDEAGFAKLRLAVGGGGIRVVDK